MKLTDKQKKQLRKEVEQEKRPRVLKFETEINKKKNEDKTIEEIMQMVKDSQERASHFISNPEVRFQKRLAEIKAQELKELCDSYNKSRGTDFSLKTFKRFNGAIDDFYELSNFLDTFIILVNVNNNTVRKNEKIWGEVKNVTNMTKWIRARKEVRKEIPNITFKQFVLQNKSLTVKEAKAQYEELMTPAPELTFHDFVMGQLEQVLSKVTNEPKELIELIAQTKLKRGITKETYDIYADIDKIVEFGNLIFNALIKN